MLDRLTDAFAGQRAFVADASHELRTPLTVIKGQIEVLAAQRDPSAEEVRRVERLVQGEIARMGRLVDDLLLLARSEHSQFLRLQSIDLVPYVAELWEGIVPLADRGFELGPVPAGTLRADPDRLAQALRNLLTNAIAHTEPGRGLVRLSAQQAPGGRLRFLVEDDGPGIAAAERERVFDRFNRTDSARDRARHCAGPRWGRRRGRLRGGWRAHRAGDRRLWRRAGAPHRRRRRCAARTRAGTRLAQDARVPDRVAPGLRPHAQAVRAAADGNAAQQAAGGGGDRVDLGVVAA